MIEGLSELIESHNVQDHKLTSIKSLLEKFNKVKMPSALQYAKFIDDLNEIMSTGND